MIRRCINVCVKCIRQKGVTSKQLMGTLPQYRVNPSKPFCNTGVDLTGTLQLATKRGRGSKLMKGYVVVFVCMSIKAVQLEVAEDLSTESFISAFRRFISRR